MSDLDSRKDELRARDPKLAESLATLEREHADRELDALSRVRALEHEVERLQKLINTPVIEDFLEGVRIESAHQVERWGEGHDLRKEPEDFFWVLGWLSGKIVHALRDGDRDKALHHTISSAALLANWHRFIQDGRGAPLLASEAQRGAVDVLTADD